MVDANRLALDAGACGPVVGAASVGGTVGDAADASLRPISLNLKPPAQDSNTHRSLWGQISDVLTGIPAGVGALVGAGCSPTCRACAHHEGSCPGRSVGVRPAGRDRVDRHAVAGGIERRGNGATNRFADADAGEPFGRTALNLRYPSRGRVSAGGIRGPVRDTVLEDAGNVSLAGSRHEGVLHCGAGCRSDRGD